MERKSRKISHRLEKYTVFMSQYYNLILALYDAKEIFLEVNLFSHAINILLLGKYR